VDRILQKISINPETGMTIARQVKDQISWLIASGTLKPGDRLPSIRKLGAHLDIHHHTVRNAYAILESEGLVTTRQGWGTKVLELDVLRIADSVSRIRSHSIGFILPSLAHPVYEEMLRGIQKVADLDQSLIFVCNTGDQATLGWRYLNQLLSKGVDGIIVASLDLEQFLPGEADRSLSESLGVPYVSIDTLRSKGYVVNLDLENVGYQATNHLIQHGHERIGLITYGFESLDYRPEDLGYQRALKESGLAINPELIAYVQSFKSADGKRAMEILLTISPPPSAVFAISDSMAVGALQTIQATGLQVPEDIALISFNDIPLAAMLTPPLTTFSMPSYQMGMESMTMLFSLIEGNQPEQREMILPTPLIIRESCGCQGS
jgi:DNA-binding LacI/PurR family transcriptional regulator